ALDAASPPGVSPTSDVHPPQQDNVEAAEQSAAPVTVPAKSSSARSSGIFGIVMSAIAAVLAGIVALQFYRPASLPAALRMKPEIRTVEVKIPPPPVAAQWVAA